MFDLDELDYEKHLLNCGQLKIFDTEMNKYWVKECVFILSAIPSFLLSYSETNWKILLKNKKYPKHDKTLNNKC